MDKQIPIKDIISSLPQICSVWYIVLAIILTLIIRIILTYFKAVAIDNGEIDDPLNTAESKWERKGKVEAFKCSFISNAKDIRIDDYWLPALIGFFELLIFPILMYRGWWTAIVAWIAIKTASSWGGWQKTRTAYNRFLFGNILSLSSSVITSLIFFP